MKIDFKFKKKKSTFVLLCFVKSLIIGLNKIYFHDLLCFACVCLTGVCQPAAIVKETVQRYGRREKRNGIYTYKRCTVEEEPVERTWGNASGGHFLRANTVRFLKERGGEHCRRDRIFLVKPV